MKTIRATRAYELVKDFESLILKKELTDSELEAHLLRAVGGKWEVTPQWVSYVHTHEPPLLPVPVFIRLLIGTKIEAGYWVGDYTGHTGEAILSQKTKADADEWVAEMRDNPYSTTLQMYEVQSGDISVGEVFFPTYL